MSNQQRRLGRGLEALLGRSLEEPAPAPAPVVEPAAEHVGEDPAIMNRDASGQLWLDLGVIKPNPHQPRKHFDEVEIADLADSIREHGVLQPLVVRKIEGRFELIAGERRLRAAQAASWQRVPVQLKEVTDQQMAEIAIVENVQRKDLGPLEKAASFAKYLQDFNCTQEDLARRVHIDRSTIANLVRLLELPEQVKLMINSGELTQGHARALLPLGEIDQQVEMAKRIKRDGLSVRATEQAIQEMNRGEEDHLRVVGEDGVSRKPGAPRNDQLASLEQELQNALGTKVSLSRNAKGKGKITIQFKDADEFERLRRQLTTQPMVQQPIEQPMAEHNGYQQSGGYAAAS